MSTTKSAIGRGKLLEAWECPGNAGTPLGCLATTFTFDPEFFEEHCLARFLNMETTPGEHGTAAYLIEREERLRDSSVTVLADHREAGIERSLAWDILPVRIDGGVMHAKVSVLAWSKVVRLVIGSANLTEPGYRSNLEIFGVFDFTNGGEPPVAELRKTLDFLADLLCHTPPGKAQSRARSFLQQVRRQIWKWKEHRRKSTIPVSISFNGRVNGKNHSVFRQLQQAWKTKSPPNQAHIFSPFFDKQAGQTVKGFAKILAKRGETALHFYLASDQEADGRHRVQAPKSLSKAEPKPFLYAIRRSENGQDRQLHAKAIWLEGARWATYMVGSSNFTTPGLGLEKVTGNVEANVIYEARPGTPQYRLLDAAWPGYDRELKNPKNIIWDPNFDDPEVSGKSLHPSLPRFFESAEFVPGNNGKGVLSLVFKGKAPESWTLFDQSGKIRLFDQSAWKANGRPERKNIKSPAGAPPCAIMVSWNDTEKQRCSGLWPVNVSDRNALPAPDQLRQLSLHALLEILCANRPLYQVLARAENSTAGNHSSNGLNPDIDPLQRFHNQDSLLPRTKRFAEALQNLKARLEKPVPNQEALHWRLRGPVGPAALAQALATENSAGRSPGEFSFLLAEIALTLGHLRLASEPGTLARTEVSKQLRSLIRELEKQAIPNLSPASPDLQSYVKRAFKEARLCH